ncbi:uncharacterized protein [Primulina eburnea]|uniref:uncharacterized protein n=1 Tax=Primulina eburnea TaxID=1245227 RepID=UPI003C6C8FF5
MADHLGDESSQGSVGRWGDQGDRRRHREHRHRRDGPRRFEMHRFIQMGPKPLVGGETPDVAEDWLERMESCFRAFQCTEEQQMETLGFLLEGRARKWWRSTSAPIVQSQGRVTWAEFRAAFMQLYFPPALRQAKTIELLNLKQGSMSVDAYQQKFFELLPFAPHISGSSEAKYDHFLQGLNQEIFDRVTVCDNPTSYDGLVNRCRQAEISLQRGRSILSSRPPNTLSPRSQSFKKSGSSSSGSGSRSSGVFRFGKKKVSCVHCGKNHPSEQCRSAAGACFQCGEMGHLKKNCPQLRGGAGSGSGSQTTVQQRTQGQAVGGSNFRPRAQGQVFALNQDQAADETGRVIAEMEDFDCILGIDLLTTYRATVDCYQKLVQFRTTESSSWFFYGEGARPPMPVVSALKACRALESGGEGYLIYAIDSSTSSVGTDDIPVVCEFPDVFPDEIPGFPPIREVRRLLRRLEVPNSE